MNKHIQLLSLSSKGMVHSCACARRAARLLPCPMRRVHPPINRLDFLWCCLTAPLVVCTPRVCAAQPAPSRASGGLLAEAPHLASRVVDLFSSVQLRTGMTADAFLSFVTATVSAPGGDVPDADALLKKSSSLSKFHRRNRTPDWVDSEVQDLHAMEQPETEETVYKHQA